MTTNTQQKAPRACDSEGLHNDTNSASDFKSKIIAVCKRIKSATSGFYIGRAISADSILLTVLAAVYVVWRVTK
jgi:hypothetical protein